MAGRKIGSIQELKTIIENKVMAALDTDVQKDVLTILEGQAKAEIYDVYVPIRYQRRGSFGEDEAYEVDKSKKMQIRITPTVPYNQSYTTSNSGDDLAGLVNYGDGWNGHSYDYWDGYQSFGYARPFLSKTQESLSEGGYRELLISALEKYGLKVK